MIKTTYLGDLRTEAVHLRSGARIITDAPTDNHGKGEAFSPTDLCAASLASCMLTIMGISARNHGLNIDGASASVNKIMASDPRRIARVEIRLEVPGSQLDERQQKILETAARTCPVAFSLAEGVEQVVEFEWV
ncbi:MAG: OsmC family protein [Bacteroidota bacterium]|jgi:putative redox protein